MQYSVSHMTFQMRIYCRQRWFISMKHYNLVVDVVMTLLVPVESYVTCGNSLIYDMTLSTVKQRRQMLNRVSVTVSLFCESDVFKTPFKFCTDKPLTIH